MIPQDALNRRKDTELRVVSLDNDPWNIFRGRYIEFAQQGGAIAVGIYLGLSTHGKLALQPFIEMRSLSQEEQRVYNTPFTLHWSSEVMLLSQESITQAFPRSREYLDSILRKHSLPLTPALTYDI